jgi:hypothetical protein
MFYFHITKQAHSTMKILSIENEGLQNSSQQDSELYTEQ